MGRETEEIVEKARKRAELLLDYLVFFRENKHGIRKKNFTRWFYEEKHSWYAVLVMQECIVLLQKENYENLKDDLYLPCALVMKDLLYRNGNRKKYYEFCREVVDYYKTPRLRRTVSNGWNSFLEMVSLEVAEYLFLEKKAYLEAPIYYEQYRSYGGDSASVEQKYGYCVQNGYVQKESIFEKINIGYIYGRALTASKEHRMFFVGRDELISRYAEKLRSGNILVWTFYGQYRVGKSSVLENLEKALENEYYTIRITMDTVDKVETFYNDFMKLLSRYGGENCKRYYREIRQNLKAEHRTGIDAEEFKVYFEEIYQLLRDDSDRQKKVLLFLDEFVSVLNKDGFQPLEGFLNRLYEQAEAGRMQVVITGAEDMRKCVERYPFFFAKNGIDELKYLSYEATVQLLEEPIRMADRTGRYPDKNILRQIYDLTKGQPYITQCFAQVIVSILNAREQNMVTQDILDIAVNKVLYDEKTYWDNRFAFLLDSGENPWTGEDVRRVCAKLQKECEQGKISKSEFEKTLSQEEFPVLRNLLERGIITRESNGEKDSLYVYLSLFGKWCYSWE